MIEATKKREPADISPKTDFISNLPKLIQSIKKNMEN